MDFFQFYLLFIFVTNIPVLATQIEKIPSLFEYEKLQLNGAVPEYENAGLRYKDSNCKSFPGDSDWPDAGWSKLNSTINGALLKPSPMASVCYNNTVYDNFASSECDVLSANWANKIERAEHPIEVNSVIFEGLTCIPPSSLDTHGCLQGGYPVYVVNVSNVAQIQAAVNFARSKQIRLVIKNTGHDFSGKSLGGGALSIWTHHLKDISYYENYTTDGYSGPAFKVGAGVQGREIYKAAFDKGLMVVGGICDSVGFYGGYTQGGGHSMLSSIHGMGADQVLSIQVVTANGNFVTASPTENTDLFWAIRGGGGSSFGVVTSMTVKAFKDTETTVGTIKWGMKLNNISVDIFWNGVSSYLSHLRDFTTHGTAAEWHLYPKDNFLGPPDGQPTFQINAFFAPGKTIEQAQAITAHWLADMQTMGINTTMNWTYFDSYYKAYQSSFSPTSMNLMPYATGYASRLIPSENFDVSKKLNVTISAFRTLAEAGHVFNGYQYAPTLKAGAPVGPEGNAIHPSWRKTLSHTIIFVKWADNATVEEQIRIRRDFTKRGMKPLRDTMPEAGSYMNEGDLLEANFQQVFYGDNYPKLLQIKKKHDPEDVFWAVTAVGSEGWAVRSVDGLLNENGPLCRIDT